MTTPFQPKIYGIGNLHRKPQKRKNGRNKGESYYCDFQAFYSCYHQSRLNKAARKKLYISPVPDRNMYALGESYYCAFIHKVSNCGPSGVSCSFNNMTNQEPVFKYQHGLHARCVCKDDRGKEERCVG